MPDLYKPYPTRPVLEGVAVVGPPYGTGDFSWIQEDAAGAIIKPDAIDVITPGRFLGGEEHVNTNADTKSAVNADATIHYQAGAFTQNHSIQGIVWSYNSTPTAGSIRIESPSGTIVLGPHPVTASGPGSLSFDKGLYGATNSDLLVRLSNGGAAVSGTLSVYGHKVR